jgi:hypothetical protein
MERTSSLRLDIAALAPRGVQLISRPVRLRYSKKQVDRTPT